MLSSDQKLHNGYMLEALNEAHIAFSEEEVPVGAILVYEDVIIARDHNRVEKKKIVQLMRKYSVYERQLK